MSLSSLSSLSSFNVSCNNLTGIIPSSTQLQSLNESCFVGNELCGDPLTVRCSRIEAPDTDHEEVDVSCGTDWGLIISVVSGFIVGFWVIVAPLITSRSWRTTYFRFLNELRFPFSGNVKTCDLGAYSAGCVRELYRDYLIAL
ncbi:leucine-rich repeat protein [Tanacetum coccineum]